LSRFPLPLSMFVGGNCGVAQCVSSAGLQFFQTMAQEASTRSFDDRSRSMKGGFSASTSSLSSRGFDFYQAVIFSNFMSMLASWVVLLAFVRRSVRRLVPSCFGFDCLSITCSLEELAYVGKCRSLVFSFLKRQTFLVLPFFSDATSFFVR